MKKNISLLLILFTCAMGILWSCSKKIDHIVEFTGTDGYAYIKFGQYSPNFRTIVGGRDSFNVYINGLKVNGSFLTFNSIFPTASNFPIPNRSISPTARWR